MLGHIVNILKNCQTVSQKWLFHFTILLEVHEDYGFFTSLSILITLFLFYFSHPSSMKWYHTVGFICIFLVTTDNEHFFMYLLANYVSSLEKCLFESFAQFLISLLFFLLLNCQSSLYIFCIQTSYEIFDLKICSLTVWIIFLHYW